MPVETFPCEVWITVDADGDYAVHIRSAEDSIELFDSDIGGTKPRRTVKVTVHVPVPVVLECEVTAPSDPAEALPVDASAE